MRWRLQNVNLSIASVYEHWLFDILFNAHGCILLSSLIWKVFVLGNPQDTLHPKPKEINGGLREMRSLNLLQHFDP